MSITRSDVQHAICALGIEPGDWMLVHSSMKSTGYVEDGPQAVIGGFLDALGPEGTLIMPTLSQKNWETVYRDWRPDRPSDVGLITEVFRKMEGVLRSNQETHSVAAKGRDAAFITEGHKAFGPRFGAFGDYAFSYSSPWQKLYDKNAAIVFWGAPFKSNTMKHMAEYMLFEEKLKELAAVGGDEDLKNQLWHYDTEMRQGVWTYLDYRGLYDCFLQEGIVTRGTCGTAELLLIPAADSVNLTLRVVKDDPEKWLTPETLAWMQAVDTIIKERKS